MELTAGARLGPYEIEARLGAGGMGEVYRARDTRLDRTVALKLLPASLSENARLQQRFEREARALAGFSHPRICTLHDVGHEGGVPFLVMELVEGETLAARVERGALPLPQVLDVGIGIADALDAAHRRGVVHRDIKPANVMLTKRDVKVLDFGLAGDAPLAARAPFAESETATRATALTAEGAIVGTLSYMAPEQLEGGEADARSDLFSLGVVLYEMTTGIRPFRGNSQAGLVAAILTGEPAALAERRPEVPAALTRAVQRCLAKDPDGRWQSARDLMLELAWIAQGGSLADGPRSAPSSGRRREWIAWGLSAVLLAATVTLVAVRTERSPSPPGVTWSSVTLPEGAEDSFSRLSPDGRTLAVGLFAEGRSRIWLRPLDSLTGRMLAGTEGGTFPFWSPDGRHIGFFADGKLHRIAVGGGPRVELCEAPGPFSMGAWSGDGSILFNVVEAPGREGIYRVSDRGGTPVRMTVVDASNRELLCAWPSFLPDYRHVVVSCNSPEGDNPGIYAVSVATGRAAPVIPGPVAHEFRAEYAAPDRLVYTSNRGLVAQRFDPDERTVSGEPVAIAERIEAFGPGGLDNFSVAGDVLVYQTEKQAHSELIWMDRGGRPLGRVGTTGMHTSVRLGPADEKAAVAMVDERIGAGDIWIFDLARDVPTRFTDQTGDDYYAIWSRDGRRIAFASARNAPPFMHVRDVAGGEDQVLLPSRGTMQAPSDWSPDGRTLLFSDRDPSTGWDLWLLRLEDSPDPVPFLRTPFAELFAVFSPNGEWVAYASNESGRMEVYVASFPHAGEKQRVSTEGGSFPVWRADASELFYLSADNRVMAVPVRWQPRIELGTPAALFSVTPFESATLPYAVTADGQRFLLISALPEESIAPTLVSGWSTLLPR